MGITVDVTTNVKTAKLNADMEKANHILAQQVMADTKKFLPFRSGSLSSRTRVTGGTITYPGPYARFLYFGVVMVDVKTGSAYAKKGHSKRTTGKPLNYSAAGTGDHWFDKSKAMNKEKWLRVYKKAVTNG